MLIQSAPPGVQLYISRSKSSSSSSVSRCLIADQYGSFPISNAILVCDIIIDDMGVKSRSRMGMCIHPHSTTRFNKKGLRRFESAQDQSILFEGIQEDAGENDAPQRVRYRWASVYIPTYIGDLKTELLI